MKGYRFWQAIGLWYNEEMQLFEAVDMEFELAFPIDDDYGRIYLQQFLRYSDLIWQGKLIVQGTLFIMSKAARRAVYVTHG